MVLGVCLEQLAQRDPQVCQDEMGYVGRRDRLDLEAQQEVVEQLENAVLLVQRVQLVDKVPQVKQAKKVIEGTLVIQAGMDHLVHRDHPVEQGQLEHEDR